MQQLRSGGCLQVLGAHNQVDLRDGEEFRLLIKRSRAGYHGIRSVWLVPGRWRQKLQALLTRLSGCHLERCRSALDKLRAQAIPADDGS